MKKESFLLDVWSFDADGQKVHPYKGERGEKKGLFSVNFTNDTNNFVGHSESELIHAIVSGKFRDRGSVRMLPLNVKPNVQRNAFGPKFYKGNRVKDY